MKWYSTFVSFVATLVLSSNAFSATIYRLALDPVDPRVLNIDVTRQNDKTATTLVYRGAAIGEGIRSQIANVTCDGHPLNHMMASHRWRVPAGCNRIRWQVRFDLPGHSDASTQRSIASRDGTFRLFSQASSFATLEDAAPPSLLFLPKIDKGLTIPAPRTDGTLVLPNEGQAPLFILLGSRPVVTASYGALTVRYFIDDPAELKNLVPVQTVLGGLQWLAGLMPKADITDFNYAWLGVSPNAASLGGATGNALMMVNYVRGGSADPTKSTVLAVAPLIEGTHLLSQPFGARNGWAEESLATYFGIEALRHARPKDKEPRALLRKFIRDARRFPLGLVAAQHHVATGDRAAYPTYFTKGVAFWAAVDAAMRATGARGLESRAKILWMMRFGPDGQPPPDFAAKLGLPEAKWLALRKEFLD